MSCRDLFSRIDRDAALGWPNRCRMMANEPVFARSLSIAQRLDG